jgi:hypothetical protein
MYHDSTILATFARWNVYIPLWSKICFARHKEISESTITTGNVEQYFGEIKVTVHPIRKVIEDIFLKAHGPAALSMLEDVFARVYLKKPGTQRQYRVLTAESVAGLTPNSLAATVLGPQTRIEGYGSL